MHFVTESYSHVPSRRVQYRAEDALSSLQNPQAIEAEKQDQEQAENDLEEVHLLLVYVEL